MGFSISSDKVDEQDEKEQKPEKKELTEEEKRQIEEQKKTQETRAKLYEAQLELHRQRREHNAIITVIRKNMFGNYLSILKGYPDKWFTASELWDALLLSFTGKSDKYNVKEKFRLTEKEFYDIFGRYPMTMANNRLYKITFLLKKRPDIEWLQDGRVHKYHYIGLKSETVTK